MAREGVREHSNSKVSVWFGACARCGSGRKKGWGLLHGCWLAGPGRAAGLGLAAGVGKRKEKEKKREEERFRPSWLGVFVFFFSNFYFLVSLSKQRLLK